MSPPRAARDFHRRGHLKCRVHMPSGGSTHRNPDCSYGNDYTRYSKCVKICCMSKVCAYKGLCSNGKCTQGLGAGQDDIYTVPGRVNYIVTKGYYCINLLYFMQKTMQKLVASNIRDETLGHVPYIYNNQPTNEGSPKKQQCTM